MLDALFSQAVIVLEKLEAKGHQAFFVGGAVRDYLLKNPVKDIDIATSATPTEVQAIFPKVIPVGIEHGTVIVRLKKQSFEVTTFRTEGNYSDFRHPDQVQFVNQIGEDLSRRDFTINAIAMDKSGDLYDPFKGQLDIRKQIISTVGNARDRFHEDPLRMMRALRFVSQLNFTLEVETLVAIKEKVAWIEEIAVERLAVEFEKTLAGQAVSDAMVLWSTVQMWDKLPVFKHDPILVQSMETIQTPLLSLHEVFAFLKMEASHVSIKDMVREWKQSNRTFLMADKLVRILHLYKQDGIHNWLLYQLPETLYEAFIRLSRILYQVEIKKTDLLAVVDSLPIQSRKEVELSGTELIALYPNREKGDWIATYLNEIEKAIVDGELLNKKIEIKEWVITCHPPKNN
ncbi:CCA tRNA nucleotidyltransferase [Paraliobacillus sp. X-1268]|uniref:CCA tRNA nucleotidyltransferase n=1 Tax=Paraliobacillus sp. X-1268 TaxID=2213193 RepID=UPI000E3E0D6D|nr:CCA tRNA nucleotidyltransferase [Paraliobacillus sp. X-1268]